MKTASLFYEKIYTFEKEFHFIHFNSKSMRTKLFIISMLMTGFALCITSCGKKQDTQIKTDSTIVAGKIFDASMNNITLISVNGDTLNISTMDADPAKVPGVMVDDSVTVTYTIDETNNVKVAKALTVTAHSPRYYLTGTWVEPNPIKPTENQGITLKEDGTAESVNMATLLFKSWRLENSTLLLKSESIGNKQTITGIDTLQIVKLNADSLILSSRGNIIWRLTRSK